MNTFGRCITRLREQEGISQEKFAAKFGVSRQTVSQWELGEQRPREATLRKICRAYGVGMDYFYAETVPCERVEGEVPPVADKKTAPEEVRACLPVWKRAAFWLALTLFSLIVIAAPKQQFYGGYPMTALLHWSLSGLSLCLCVLLSSPFGLCANMGLVGKMSK